MRDILVIGGAGYVGSVLVPKLLDKGYRVKVLDLFIYGDDVLSGVRGNPNLTSFIPLVDLASRKGISRFIYASSSSVYGVKDEDSVTEDMRLDPMTDYAKYKGMCEVVLGAYRSPEFIVSIVRPASISGYSPRLRLDLITNIMTNHAVNTGKITILGGEQMRPNLHIKDMVDAYMLLLTADDELANDTFNVGGENYTVSQIAEIVRATVKTPVELVTVPTNDTRSYKISSEKIARILGFVPSHTIQDAVTDLVEAFDSGLIPNSMTDSRYFNIKLMQEIGL